MRRNHLDYINKDDVLLKGLRHSFDQSHSFIQVWEFARSGRRLATAVASREQRNTLQKWRI